ncbi:Transposon Tf2-9 poly, partial [Paramuricea clavata]
DKVQLLSGACPRHITKARLKEWLSYREGTSKDGSAKSDATKAELGCQLYKKWLGRRFRTEVAASIKNITSLKERYGHIQNIELLGKTKVKIYRKQKKKNPKPLTNPRLPCDRNDDCQIVNKEFLNKIKEVIPNCGFVCLLSDEKLDQNKSTGTIISPIKEHPVSLTEIFNRAERVKRNLIVDEQERTNITNATKKQSKSKEWYLHRHVRITASKCKRALLKPTTSPSKAIREILHYNGDYQSTMIKQLRSGR